MLWAVKKLVGSLLTFLGLASALGLPGDIFTWARCVRHGDRFCDPIRAALPADPSSWWSSLDPWRVISLALGIVGLLLLLPASISTRRSGRPASSAPDLLESTSMTVVSRVPMTASSSAPSARLRQSDSGMAIRHKTHTASTGGYSAAERR